MARVASGLPWLAAAIIAAAVVWRVGLDFWTTALIVGLCFLAMIGSLLITGPEAPPSAWRAMRADELKRELEAVRRELEAIRRVAEEARDLLRKISEELAE